VSRGAFTEFNRERREANRKPAEPAPWPIGLFPNKDKNWAYCRTCQKPYTVTCAPAEFSQDNNYCEECRK
jgi:hypothetical protein